MAGRENPTHGLKLVVGLLDDARIGEKRALRCVTEQLGLSAAAAGEFIRARIRALKEEDFAGKETMVFKTGKVFADKYGCKSRGITWFIKFYVSENTLVVTSCHEIEEPLKLADGRTLKGATK